MHILYASGPTGSPWCPMGIPVHTPQLRQTRGRRTGWHTQTTGGGGRAFLTVHDFSATQSDWAWWWSQPDEAAAHAAHALHVTGTGPLGSRNGTSGGR